ncbi:MAG TPA: MFS transporter [Anaeromyxobacteraceae bacterium]|nr:MFS transporter [Anaeromyxobacteraceae bacterium]
MSLADNVPRLLAFRFLSDFIVVMPAIVPLYRQAGLSATEIMLVQAAFSAAAVLFEVPSGYLADVAGRRRALLAAMVAQAVAMAAYGLAPGFWAFAAAEVVLAFAYSLISGTSAAILFDSLRAAGDEGRYHRLESRGEALTRLGTAVASVLGGFLAVLSLRLPFAVNVATAFAGFLVLRTVVEPPRALLSGHQPLRELLRVSTEALRDRRLQATMVLSTALLVAGITSIWGYFMRLSAEGISLGAYGVYFALYQAASAAGAATSHRVSSFLGRRGSVALLAVVPVTLLACAADGSWRPILLTPLASAAWGFSTPFLLDALNRNIASERRATVLSVSSLLGRVLLVIVGPAFGWISDRASDRAAFATLAAVFLLLAAAAGLLHRRAALPAAAATL